MGEKTEYYMLHRGKGVLEYLQICLINLVIGVEYQ